MTTPTPTANCSTCGKPCAYIRTREFETQIAHVWMCENEKCKQFRLYWHTDHMKPSTPTEADRRAAESIGNSDKCLNIGSYSDGHYDPDEAAQIIATAMVEEREALAKAKKSIDGLSRLVEELKTAAGNIGTLNAITIGAYLGEAQAALTAIEKVTR